MPLSGLTLVLGGANSGKSAFAERLVMDHPRPLYIATAQIFDDEMAAKVAQHRAARGPDWDTVEEPLDMTRALQLAAPDQPILLDCATMWLTNVILGEHDVDAHVDTFLAGLADQSAPTVLVSNEVGYGIVPENALARRFRAAQGHLNQRLAAQADRVIAVMAGLPLALKGQL